MPEPSPRHDSTVAPDSARLAALPGEPPDGAGHGAGTVTTAAEARTAITALLDRLPGDLGATRRDALLAATELVTNAIRHGGGLTGFRAHLAPDGTVLRIEVEDATDQHPRQPGPDAEDPHRLGGRGWAIVLRLSTTCTVQPLPAGGKRVSITLRVG
ncbi:ATP-binding protein [Kitasatospora purpeofusca]|uniref:ATP-binding protein n=1 Tax=Kitasatospora purpeofusca TaxID=67352 RepID=UPI0006905C78|nr:ATP-binding protein [Kitasatospora purpeofusca]